jgi:hypothetical protein
MSLPSRSSARSLGFVALLVSLVLTALGGVAGCGGAPATPAGAASSGAAPAPSVPVGEVSKADATPDGGDGAKVAPAAVAAAPPADAAPTTRVLEAGKAPRRALRYTFPSKPEWLEMDLKMSMSIGMNGPPGAPVDIPTVRMWTRIDPKERTPEGDLRCAFVTERVQVLDDVKIPAEMRAKLDKEMGGLVGLSGSSRISTRGIATEVDFTVPPTASESVKKSMDSLRDAIRQMYVPLPQEEVGVGARWVVTMKLPVSGASMEVEATYTLKELRADGMRADVAMRITAPSRQLMKLPALPQGATALLDSLSGEGLGKVSPSFTRLAGEGSARMTMETTIEISAAGDHLRMAMTTETAVTSRPSKGPPASKAAKGK